MYYPFILYFNKYVFNLAAHKTAVKPLCNVFCFHPLQLRQRPGFVPHSTPFTGKERAEKEKIYCIYICYMDTCISGISHSGRPREGGNLFTVLWGVLERAKNIFFNRLYSIKNMFFTVLRTQKKTSHLLTRYFFDA